jgi:hypothetical protein
VLEIAAEFVVHAILFEDPFPDNIDVVRVIKESWDIACGRLKMTIEMSRLSWREESDCPL